MGGLNCFRMTQHRQLRKCEIALSLVKVLESNLPRSACMELRDRHVFLRGITHEQQFPSG